MKRGQQILKWIKITIISIIAIIILIVTSAVFISIKYGDKVSNIIIKQINKNINAKISVSKTDLSLIRYFPSTTITFYDIDIKSNTKLDTLNNCSLLNAKELSIKFNIISIFSGNYQISGITIRNSLINIVIDKYKKNNLTIWNESNNSAESIKFNLHNIQILNSLCNFINQKDNIKLNIDIQQLKARGVFKFDLVDFKITSRLNNVIYSTIIQEYKINTKLFISSNIAQFKDGYTFDNGELIFLDQNIDFLGKFNSGYDNSFSFIISGNHVDILPIIEKLGIPSGKDIDLKRILISGEARIYGNTKDKFKLFIDSKLVFDKLDFSYKKFKNVSIENGKGEIKYFPNLERIMVKTLEFNGKTNNYSFSITGALSNYPIQKISIEGQISGDIANLDNYFDAKEVKFSRGELKMDFSLNSLKDFQFNKPFSYRSFDIKSNIILDSATLQYGDFYKINKLYCNVLIGNSGLKIYTLTAVINNNNLKLEGSSNTGILYFTDSVNNNISANLKIETDKINLNDLLVLDYDSKKKKSHAQIKIELKSNELVYNKFNAYNLNASLVLNDNEISCNKLNFNAFNGNFKDCDILLGRIENKRFININALFNRLNINDIFSSFNNFGQQKVTNTNLSGELSGNLNFTSNLDENNELLYPTIIAESEIAIKYGKLSNLVIAKKVFKFLKLDEQNELSFKEFKERIKIEDNYITFSLLALKTNVIDFTVSGVHSFDNDYDYHFQFNAMDLMKRKSNLDNSENLNIAIEADTIRKMNVFVRLYGNGDNYKLVYDNKLAFKSFVSKINSEKQEIIKILKEELGLVKEKSSTKTRKPLKIESDEFNNSKKPKPLKPVSETPTPKMEWKDE